MVPGSNAGTAMTSTFVKAALKPENTTLVIPLAESMSLVSHTFRMMLSVFSCVCKPVIHSSHIKASPQHSVAARESSLRSITAVSEGC